MADPQPLPGTVIRRVTHRRDRAREPFQQLYREAFNAPPYDENYSAERVIDEVWEPLLPYGLFVAERDGRLAGLCAALPAHIPWRPDVQRYLQRSYPHPLEQTVYMAELAVAPFARRQGLGMAMIRARLQWADEQGLSWYVVRTAASGSQSLGLYARLEATPLEPVHHPPDGTPRRYLFGPVR